jgi:hypothetical protein
VFSVVDDVCVDSETSVMSVRVHKDECACVVRMDGVLCN